MNLFEINQMIDRNFDIIQFNFPHVGNTVTDENWILDNEELLRYPF